MEASVNKIKGYRVMAGLTQEEMADKLGIVRMTYVNKELGKTKFSEAEKIAIVSILNANLNGIIITRHDIFLD